MNHRASERDELLFALDDCRSRIAGGESLEQCVSSHPEELRDELREMLAIASRVSSSALDPEPAFVERLEAHLRAPRESGRARPGADPRGIPWWGSTFRRLAIGFAACLVLVVGTGFVAAEASSDALPGEPLYQVKQLRERVELWLARSDSAEFSAYRTLIDRRTAEVERATSEGQAERIAERLRNGLAASVRETVDRAIRLNSAGHPEAVERAMTSLSEAQRRLRLLAETTRDPQQLRLLNRIDRFIEEEIERLQRPDGTFRERRSGEHTGRPSPVGPVPRKERLPRLQGLSAPDDSANSIDCASLPVRRERVRLRQE